MSEAKVAEIKGPVARTPDGVWLSTVTGDRVCASCGFNLVGQPIVREEKYGLLIVRCPECAAVAALQEYPSMGVWAKRIGALAAAIWVLIVVAGGFAMGGALMGFTMMTLSAGSKPLADQIELDHREWQKEQGSSAATLGYFSGVTQTWWAQQDPAALYQASGGTPTALRRTAGALPVMIIPGFGFGVAISVLALHRRGWRLAILTAIPIAIAACFVTIVIRGSTGAPGAQWPGNLATEALASRLAPVALGTAWLMMMVGALVGRRVARWLLRLMLPPRLLAPLATLWLCDGLPAPRPDGRRARSA